VILLGQTLNVAIVMCLVGGHWALPSRLGVPGILCVQCVTVVAWFVMGYIALATGLWDWEEYNGILTCIGLLIQAIAVNIVMLPLNVLAFWRFGRRRRDGN